MNILGHKDISDKLVELVWYKVYKQMKANINPLLADKLATIIHIGIHDNIDSRTRNQLRIEISNKIYDI